MQQSLVAVNASEHHQHGMLLRWKLATSNSAITVSWWTAMLWLGRH
jgi:hypothetical protein